MKVRQMILLAMATHTPMLAEAALIQHSQGMNGTKNGHRSMFKQNRRAQIKRNKRNK